MDFQILEQCQIFLDFEVYINSYLKMLIVDLEYGR